MSQPMAECEVTVVQQGEVSVLVTDGDVEEWVPHVLIDDGSEITADSEEGDEGLLVIPLWKAEHLGLG